MNASQFDERDQATQFAIRRSWCSPVSTRGSGHCFRRNRVSIWITWRPTCLADVHLRRSWPLITAWFRVNLLGKTALSVGTARLYSFPPAC